MSFCGRYASLAAIRAALQLSIHLRRRSDRDSRQRHCFGSWFGVDDMYASSAASLRARCSASFPFGDCSRRSFACSSSGTCCGFCCNAVGKVPRIPNYGYSMLGLRQSDLIRRLPCRNLICSGLDWCYYARLPVCDFAGGCYSDNFRRIREKRRVRECRVVGDERYGDTECVNEGEIMLSFLTECFNEMKETRKLLEKAVEESRDGCEVNNKCGGKKGRVDLGVLKTEPRRANVLDVGLKKGGDRRRAETNQIKGEKQGLMREGNQGMDLVEEHEKTLLMNRTGRSDERRAERGENEKKIKLRKKNWNVKSNTHGSDCHDEVKEEGFVGEVSSGHSKVKSVVYQKIWEEDQGLESYKEDHDVHLMKKSSKEELRSQSRIIESDFTKKSEEELANLPMHMEGSIREKTSLEGLELSGTREGNINSDYYTSSVDGQAKASMRFDEERKQKLRQTPDEISRPLEPRLKYKQFEEMRNSHSDDRKYTHGSQEICGGKGKMAADVASSSQQAIGLAIREDGHSKNSPMPARISEIEDIDINKSSSSQHVFLTSFKEVGYSDSIRHSINDAAMRQQQYDQVGGMHQLREEPQHSTKKDSKSISERISDKAGQRSSLNQSTSSGTWFSCDEVGAHVDKEQRSIRLQQLREKHQHLTKKDSKSSSESISEKTGQRSSPNQSISSDAWFSCHEVEGATGDKEQRSIRLHQSREEPQHLTKQDNKSTSESISEKTGQRSSPNQSTSSGTWFSGHEVEGATGDKEPRSITPNLSNRQQEDKLCSQVEDSPSSSTLEGRLKLIGANLPTGAVVIKEQQQNKKLKQEDVSMENRYNKWEKAYMLEVEQREVDEMFMREALCEAQNAADSWEVPVGAVLVQDGKVIARGCNLVEEMRDSTLHAEMICIKEASKILQTWRLWKTTLYVTLEPCPMCAGAIYQARIDTVVWGAPNKLLGADGSWIRLFPNGHRRKDSELSDKPAAPVHPFHPNITVRRGVLAPECADIMQQFFKLRRKNKDKKSAPSSSPRSCLPTVQHPSKFLAKIRDAFSWMFSK